MRNTLIYGRRPVTVILLILLVQTMLGSALSGCGVSEPASLRIVRSLGTRDTGFVDRPLAAAATKKGAMLLALRADGEAEIVELDANRAPTAFFRLAGLLDASPHEFGLLPDGRLAVRTKADRVQIFARDPSGVYAVTSTLPAGGPLAVAPDGSLYVGLDGTIRRYSSDGKLLSNWSIPGRPAALAWNAVTQRVCAFIPASQPEELRVIERSAVYAAPNYGSERLGAIERGVLVTVEQGSAPMDGFIRVSAPYAGFVPAGCVASVIGTLCQYTSEGGTGSLFTVSCDYAPACSANRSPEGIAVGPDGRIFLLLREQTAAGQRRAIVAVGDAGFGYIRCGTLPSALPNRRPYRASIADAQAAGLACTGSDILVVDGLNLWRTPVSGGSLTLIAPAGQPDQGAFREPAALTVDGDAVTVLDWLRGDVQTWTGAGFTSATPVPSESGETAFDLLTGRNGVHWLAITGGKSARVAALEQAQSYPVSAILAEGLNLSAWWLEPDQSAAGPPLIVAGWGERILSNTKGVWIADPGGYAYPWDYYLPDSAVDIASFLRRAGILPKASGATPPNWAELIRGMTRGPDGALYLVTGRVSIYGMRIFVFGPDGQLSQQYRLPPEVGLPSDIAVDHDGHIWLTDPEHYRVVELEATSGDQ